MTKEIAFRLEIEEPYVSRGGSVDANFLPKVLEALGGSRVSGSSLRQTSAVLDALGLAYDPYWDTSAGGTVTTRAYSRILSAIREVPRTFIASMPNPPAVSAEVGSIRSTYKFDGSTRTTSGLVDAGPGSKILFYETSTTAAQSSFVSVASVRYISPSYDGPWTAHLTDHQRLAQPVVGTSVRIADWQRRNSITEIDFSTFEKILYAGDVHASHLHVPETSSDPGAEFVQRRRAQDTPLLKDSLVVDIPAHIPAGVIPRGNDHEPSYVENVRNTLIDSNNGDGSRRSVNSERDRETELRAVDAVQAAMKNQGWALQRDCQRDGTGYDLEFLRNGRLLKVEVKGIRGNDLKFNLTPKELWRAENDEAWILVAVLGTFLKQPRIVAITREAVLNMTRTITGYRLS